MMLLVPHPFAFSSEVVKEIERLLASGFAGWPVRLRMYYVRNRLLLSDEEFRAKYAAYWKKAGVTVISASVYSGGTYMHSFESSLMGVADTIALCENLGDIFVKVTDGEHARQAKEENKLGVIMNFQNTEQIKGSLDNLELFYNLGVRIIQLTYNLRNLVGNGCTERTDDGLSWFGLKVVDRMNELGMLIDLSHCGDKTSMDAIEYSKQPCAFTHSFPRALHDHPRGKTDELLKALAEKGGYIGVTAVPWMFPKRTVNDFVKYIEYLVNLIGIDHIGVGTDWSSPFHAAEGFR